MANTADSGSNFSQITGTFDATGGKPLDISSVEKNFGKLSDIGNLEENAYKKAAVDIKKAETPTSYPHTRGAAVSVFNSGKLGSITFVPGSDGGMSAAVAYIRYWSRKSSELKVNVGQGTNAAPSTPSDYVAGNLARVVPPAQITPTITPSGFTTRRVFTTPTNFLQQGAKPNQPVLTTIRTPIQPQVRAGSVYSANPGGANPFTSVSPSEYPPTNAVWQFMFNPEELQLTSGPDFNRAESWGVPDRANGGQPLSWRSNRNRKLSFGKIILHGYSLGKRVDYLEKGLQALFEARDGENGSDGPPVLEFVWGARVFGPCVIQNIQVREKAWDKGVLVNAEVSFELEQVPEWTINDGFVDVLRPARQPTINDPIVSPRSAPGTSTGAESGADGSGESPPANNPGGQPSSTAGGNANLCNFAVEQSRNFQRLFNRADSQLSVFRWQSSQDMQRERGIADEFISLKDNFYSSSSEIGNFVDSKLNGGSCMRGKYEELLKQIDSQTSLRIESRSRQKLQFIHGCIKQTKAGIDDWQQTSPKCKPQRVAGQIEANCQKYAVGQPCSAGFGTPYSGCASLNGGRGVICREGRWVLN